jgi:hypothetical protein
MIFVFGWWRRPCPGCLDRTVGRTTSGQSVRTPTGRFLVLGTSYRYETLYVAPSCDRVRNFPADEVGPTPSTEEYLPVFRHDILPHLEFG